MTNKQLSLFEQGQEAWPGLADVEIVRALTEQVLAEADARPPVDVEMLASMRGISRVEEANQPFAGMLLPSGGRLVVRVRSTDSRERRRFTILHEAGHTLLPGFSEKTQYRCAGSANRAEILSDVAASELLFPRAYFTRDLLEVQPGLPGVEILAAMYDASIEATARRSVELRNSDTALLVFAVAHKPAERGLEEETAPRLRLQYNYSRGQWPFMRRHKSVDEDSVFQRALDGEMIEEVADLGSLSPTNPGPLAISARRYGKDGRVIALIERSAQRGGFL